MNPAAVTTQAVDAVFLYIFGICILMLVGITATLLFFIVRYRRSRNPRPLASPHYHLPLEAAWTIIPTILVLTMFWYGWAGYTTLSNVPENALEVKVSGRQWSWVFEYPNGKISDKLVVPVDRAIKLSITSEDVLHSFYVPAFRIKKDAVPGMTTHAWFQAPTEGAYDAFCAEYCGTGHADMITTVEALPEDDFDAWYETKPEEERAEALKILQKHGCLGCHSLDGSEKTGPTFQGLFGKQVTVTTDGKERTVTADADYIRRAILQPGADLVKGYPAVMPSFEGRISDHEIEEIVEFLQGGGQEAGKVSGKELARQKGCLGCHSTDGSRKAGPTWKGLYGKQVTVERDGQKLTLEADTDYLRRAILHPQAETVKGYQPLMPAAELTEEEVTALIEYIKSLE